MLDFLYFFFTDLCMLHTSMARPKSPTSGFSFQILVAPNHPDNIHCGHSQSVFKGPVVSSNNAYDDWRFNNNKKQPKLNLNYQSLRLARQVHSSCIGNHHFFFLNLSFLQRFVCFFSIYILYTQNYVRTLRTHHQHQK